MTLVLIAGGIDLSVGSVMALWLGGAGAGARHLAAALPVAIVLCLGVGLLAGLINGLVTVRWGVPSFIVTLGMLEIARGGAYLVTQSRTVFVGAAIGRIGTPLLESDCRRRSSVPRSSSLPVRSSCRRPSWAAISWPSAPTRRLRVFQESSRGAFWSSCSSMSGVLAGLGGFFHVAYLESADPNSRDRAGVVGHRGRRHRWDEPDGRSRSVVSSFFGVLIIAVLQSGLAQVGASEPAKRIVTGGGNCRRRDPGRLSAEDRDRHALD